MSRLNKSNIARCVRIGVLASFSLVWSCSAKTAFLGNKNQQLSIEKKKDAEAVKDPVQTNFCELGETFKVTYHKEITGCSADGVLVHSNEASDLGSSPLYPIDKSVCVESSPGELISENTQGEGLFPKDAKLGASLIKVQPTSESCAAVTLKSWIDLDGDGVLNGTSESLSLVSKSYCENHSNSPEILTPLVGGERQAQYSLITDIQDPDMPKGCVKAARVSVNLVRGGNLCSQSTRSVACLVEENAPLPQPTSGPHPSPSPTPTPKTNQAPVFAPMPDRTLVDNQSLSNVPLPVTDADGDNLNLRCLNCSGTFSVSVPNKTFSWTPKGIAGGKYTFEFEASDGNGGVATGKLNVNFTNSRPVILNIAEQNIGWNKDFSLVVPASDPEGRAVTVKCVSCPAGMTLTNTSGTWTLKWSKQNYVMAGWLGNTPTVTLSASDGVSDSVSRSFVVKTSADPSLVGGRLSMTYLLTPADVSFGYYLYYVSCGSFCQSSVNDKVALYNSISGIWEVTPFMSGVQAGNAYGLSANALYDVYASKASTGYVTFSIVPFNNAAKVTVDGFLVSSSDYSKRWLGIVGTDSSGNVIDMPTQRLVFNKYNQTLRTISAGGLDQVCNAMYKYPADFWSNAYGSFSSPVTLKFVSDGITGIKPTAAADVTTSPTSQNVDANFYLLLANNGSLFLDRPEGVASLGVNETRNLRFNANELSLSSVVGFNNLELRCLVTVNPPATAHPECESYNSQCNIAAKPTYRGISISGNVIQ